QPMKVRLVAATSCDLRERVRRGQFNEDLYRQLSACSVAIPPLAEHTDDIPELALAFARWSAERMNKRVTGIASETLVALREYAFPGNVRELRNIIECAVMCTRGRLISEGDLMLDVLPRSDFFRVPLRSS